MIDWTGILILVVKTVVVAIMLVQVVPIMVWVERRGSALIQNRLGPNRVGPLGLLQSLADAFKFLSKEHVIPAGAHKSYYALAPLIAVIPAFMAFAAVPFGGPLSIGGRVIPLQAADLNVGLLYIFAIASLGVYGIIVAGWASNNKYALLGSLRSSSQMISYELSYGLSIIGILMVFSSLSLGDIVVGQAAPLLTIGGITIPKWGVFIQPIGFLIFLTASYAETNRLPFDLPEGESEIVAGYHLEYGPAGFSTFMMAEYINMTTSSALAATLFFGGYQLLPGMGALLDWLALSGDALSIARAALEVASFTIKVVFFLWLFVWVRWTIPRFRYDQLMDLGWRVMFPLALANVVATAGMIYMGWI